MRTIDIHEVKTPLSSFAEVVESGAEIIITKAGRPIMKLVPIEKKKKRQFGFLAGQIRVSSDFDAPLSYDLSGPFAPNGNSTNPV